MSGLEAAELNERWPYSIYSLLLIEVVAARNNERRRVNYCVMSYSFGSGAKVLRSFGRSLRLLAHAVFIADFPLITSQLSCASPHLVT